MSERTGADGFGGSWYAAGGGTGEGTGEGSGWRNGPYAAGESGGAGSGSAAPDPAWPGPGLVPGQGDVPGQGGPAGSLARPGRWRQAVAATAAALVLAAASAVGGGAAGYLVSRQDVAAPATAATATTVSTSTREVSLADLIAQVKDQVVSIAVTGASGASEGSGIVVRSTGVILTNYHVISDAVNGGRITVTFADGSSSQASIAAGDAGKDLALVQLDGVSNLAVATFGDSDSVQVGDTVVAIGNELGLAGSASAGIVSGVDRTLDVGSDQGRGGRSSTTYADAIQTDAAVNPGHSGGALFNTVGQVIGVNFAIASTGESSGSIGIGFAIPSNDAVQFIRQNLDES